MEEPGAVVAERIVRELLGSPSTSNANITVHGASNWQLNTAWAVAVLGFAFGVFGLHTANKTDENTRLELLQMQRKLDRMEDYQVTSYMLFPDFRKQIEENLNKRKPEK